MPSHPTACCSLILSPGKINYNGAQIQLLDLPGIIEGAAQGKGRGRQGDIRNDLFSFPLVAILIQISLQLSPSRKQPT